MGQTGETGGRCFQEGKVAIPDGWITPKVTLNHSAPVAAKTLAVMADQIAIHH